MAIISKLGLVRQPMPIVRKASLSLISSSYTLRCDAKQAEERFEKYDELISSVDHFYLGKYLPKPFIKASQPKYLESLDSTGIPVINTLSIQDLRINRAACRFISEEDYDNLADERKLNLEDILLTVDGGTSIGKPALFDLDDDFTIDSHIAVIRNPEINPQTVIYLLASPFGQLQFQQAESGASGQTAVTEEDIRRFKFPKIQMEMLDSLVKELDSNHRRIEEAQEQLQRDKEDAWEKFNLTMLEYASIRK